MHKILKIVGIGAILLIIFFFGMWVGENETNNTSNPIQTNQTVPDSKPKTESVTAGELMQKNDPDVKRLSFATADYVGKSFTLYVIGEVADYYNFGFRNEVKYYSFRLCDSSVTNKVDCVYAYIDKSNPEVKAKELFDILLKEQTFLKLDVSIPTEKYQEHSNSFLEIKNWEVIPLTKAQ